MTYSTRPGRTASSRRTPLIIGGVLLLSVIAGVLLALALARSPETATGDPTPTPIASPAASPGDEPSPESPTEAPEPTGTPAVTPEPEQPGVAPVVTAPDGVLPPGSVVRVVVDSLRVRQEPTTGAGELELLSRGDLVVLGYSYLNSGFGPIEADGFVWYPVSPLGISELPDPTEPLAAASDGGWAAVGDGADLWVELVEPRCVEGDPDLALLQALTEWERLACYGDRPITVEGVLGCADCGGQYPGTFEPGWLAMPLSFNFLSVEPSERIGPFRLRFPPDGPESPFDYEARVAPILRVMGHFDDPAAGDCTIATLTNANEPIDDVVAELYCRAQFVVDSYEQLGTDEDFPFR